MSDDLFKTRPDLFVLHGRGWSTNIPDWDAISMEAERQKNAQERQDEWEALRDHPLLSGPADTIEEHPDGTRVEVRRGGQLILLSTPLSKAGLAWKLYKEALNGPQESVDYGSGTTENSEEQADDEGYLPDYGTGYRSD